MPPNWPGVRSRNKTPTLRKVDSSWILSSNKHAAPCWTCRERTCTKSAWRRAWSTASASSSHTWQEMCPSGPKAAVYRGSLWVLSRPAFSGGWSVGLTRVIDCSKPFRVIEATPLEPECFVFTEISDILGTSWPSSGPNRRWNLIGPSSAAHDHVGARGSVGCIILWCKSAFDQRRPLAISSSHRPAI